VHISTSYSTPNDSFKLICIFGEVDFKYFVRHILDFSYFADIRSPILQIKGENGNVSIIFKVCFLISVSY